MSWLSNLIGLGDNGTDNWYESSSFIGPAITTAGSLFAGLAKPDSTPYAQSSDYLNAQLALEREKFEADKAYKEQALALQAQQGGGGAGASAARYAAQLGARVNLAQLKNQMLADQIKYRIENAWGKPELTQAYNSNIVNAMQQKAAAGQQGFNAAAAILAGARRQ